jgi:hypothetical protein
MLLLQKVPIDSAGLPEFKRKTKRYNFRALAAELVPYGRRSSSPADRSPLPGSR